MYTCTCTFYRKWVRYNSCVHICAPIFTKFEILAHKIILDHHIKCHEDRSFRCRDICITILAFLNHWFLMYFSYIPNYALPKPFFTQIIIIYSRKKYKEKKEKGKRLLKITYFTKKRKTLHIICPLISIRVLHHMILPSICMSLLASSHQVCYFPGWKLQDIPTQYPQILDEFRSWIHCQIFQSSEKSCSQVL